MIQEKENLMNHPLLEDTESPIPNIEISVFTERDDCCSPLCCGFLPLSQVFDHSSVIIEHLPTGKKYLISLSGVGFLDNQERINNLHNIEKFSEFKSATIKAFEKDDKTFANFKNYFFRRFREDCKISVCSSAVEFTLDYFPRVPSESCSSLFFRQSYKCLFGVFGTFLLMRACPTLPFPGLTSPAEMEKYSKKIERDQKFFSESRMSPKRESMTDDNQLKTEYSRNI